MTDNQPNSESGKPGWSAYEVWRTTIQEPRARAQRLKALDTRTPLNRVPGKPEKRRWWSVFSHWIWAR